ncbi:MAG TPA: urate hydroxylase PuuD, partial [Bacteroidia bacterium]|nr:urate hydroxylase PuuD [Bacteroidia bacterium]
MKRYLRWIPILGVWMVLAFAGKAQDSASTNLIVKDSSAVAATTAPVAPAAAEVVTAIPTGIDFDSRIEGTPFSLLTLVVVALLALGALIAGLLYLLEHTIHLQAAKVEGQQEKLPLHARLAMLHENLKLLRKVFTVGMAVFIVGFWIHHQIKGSPWESHVNEWMNLIVRWGHVTFGVAWIGASFYFIFLENALYRGPGIREGLAGNLWAIHGGGFYYVEKYKVAPEKLPAHLHWFKWEAYITWISGICLLFVVYYFNASSLLVDKTVADISNGTAIAIGISTLVLSWFVYDILCKSPLVLNKPVFFFLMLGYLTLIAFFLSQWLSPRAAYIHVGAVIGTMMAGNVWRVIIP